MARVRALPIYAKQAEFRKALAKVKAFIGGRGCVAPETMVSGVPIAERTGSVPLSTLFGIQRADIPFLKGKADLYRVRTRSGLEVVTTDAHRFLTPDGWKCLLYLKANSLIAIGGGSSEDYTKETGRDWKDRYLLNSRLGGELPSPLEVARLENLQRSYSIDSDSSLSRYFRASLPSIENCLSHQPFRSSVGHLVPRVDGGLSPMDSLIERKESLQSLCMSFQTDRVQSSSVRRSELLSFDHPSASLLVGQECLSSTCGYESTLDCSRAYSPSEAPLSPARLSFESRSPECLSCSSWDEIESITWVRKGEFWDLHVPVQNHYSAHGIWHHNTGKTFIGAQEILMTGKYGDPWVCVSPDNNVIRESTFPIFSELAKRTGQFVKEVLSPMPRITFRTVDGGIATLVFRSGEAPEKLRGGNYAGAWLDEATVMNKLVYDLIRPTLRWRGRMGPTLITATPKGTKHWTFEKFYEPVEGGMVDNGDRTANGVEFINGRAYRRKPGTCLIKASTADNPFLPPDFYDSMKGDYGQMLAQQELEGEFVEVAGLMFRREWFQSVHQAPADCIRVRYWDQAATPGSGCYTAGLLLAIDQWGIYYIENVIRGQWGSLERNRVIDQVTDSDSRRHRGEVLTFVEQEGGSAGKEIAAQMITRLSGHAVFRDVVSGKRHRVSSGERLPGEAKVIRATGVAAAAENGNIRIVQGNWNEDFLSELAAFPEYRFCDQVDAFSGAFNRISAHRRIDPGETYRHQSMPAPAPAFGALATLQRVREERSWESMPWAQDISDGQTE